MTCDLDRIDALLSGELPEGEQASVLEHTESCPACRAYYDAMAALEGTETVPEGFTARVMDAVRTTPQTKVHRRGMWRGLAAMAACAALVLGLGFGSGIGATEADNAGESYELVRGVDDADAASAPDGNTADDQTSDSMLAVHTLTDTALCQQVRSWLAEQNISQLYPDGPREAYDLTAQQVQMLNRDIPLLALPENALQLELKSAE